MKKGTFGQILHLAVTLFLITAIVAGVLAGVNAITADRIAEAKAEKSRQAMEAVLPGAEDLAPLELTAECGIVSAVYAPGEDSPVQGFVVEVVPSGFGGDISMMVGIQDGAVSGVSIVSHAESPSLGAVISESGSKGQAFRDQFIGQSGTLAVTKDGGAIDAITSATISSRAVTEGVNAALEYVKIYG